MVDGNENYKFDLGVRVKVPKKDLSHAIPKLHPELSRGLLLLRIEYFQQLHLRKPEKYYFVWTDVKNIGVSSYLSWLNRRLNSTKWSFFFLTTECFDG